MDISQLVAIGAMVIPVIGGVVLFAASVRSANKRYQRLDEKAKRLNKMRRELDRNRGGSQGSITDIPEIDSGVGTPPRVIQIQMEAHQGRKTKGV